MEPFEYAAMSQSGSRTTGTVMASSAREARDILRGRLLTPIEIKASKIKKAAAFSFQRSVAHKDKTLASRQMAILLATATPVEEALKVTALQFERSPMRDILLDVRARVLEGARLADAMRAHPQAFSPLYIAMVGSAETSGRLPAVMERLAQDMEASQKMRRKIMGATLYPLVLSVVAILVVIFLMVALVPKLVAQFDSFGAELPALTRAVMAISQGLQAYGALLLVGVVIMFVAAYQALKRPAIKRAWHGRLLRLPLIGRINRDLNAARFARTLSGLMDSGTPALPAMETARFTLGNLVLRDAVSEAIVKVSEGQAMSTALRASGVFPPLVTQMLSGGEAGGSVPLMLSKAADYLEEEFDAATTVFMTLLEPLIIIGLAMIILLIIGAIFLPILQLNTLAF